MMIDRVRPTMMRVRRIEMRAGRRCVRRRAIAFFVNVKSVFARRQIFDIGDDPCETSPVLVKVTVPSIFAAGFRSTSRLLWPYPAPAKAASVHEIVSEIKTFSCPQPRGGEHRLPARPFRQLAEKSGAQSSSRFSSPPHASTRRSRRNGQCVRCSFTRFHSTSAMTISS